MAEDTEDFSVVKGVFQDLLNRHGFGLQYRVLKEAASAFAQSGSSSLWRFEAAEVPVRAQNRDTKIDFILSRHRPDASLRRYLICECKRVNPARANWVFMRAPYTHRKRRSGYQDMLIEAIEFREGEVKASAHPGNMIDSFSIGLAVKTQDTGDKVGKLDDDAIEGACYQVLLGVNGFVNTLADHPYMTPRQRDLPSYALLAPVIFTTAKLFVCDVDLSLAELSTGTIDLTSSKLQQVPWLWFGYNTSPALRHALESRSYPAELHQLMDDAYIRHVAIVNTGAIRDFLEWSSDSDSSF